MKAIICFFKGYVWGKLKTKKGFTNEHNKKNRLLVKSHHWTQKCKRCGEMEYWSTTSTK